MVNQKLSNELKNQISISNNIAIFGHDNVDGDCLGAMLGLGSLLENMSKNISYHTSFEVPEYLQFLPNIKKITTEFDFVDYDLVLVLDMNNISRISKFDISKYENIFIIDHHPFSHNISYLNIIDTNASSACELIREYIYYLYPDLITEQIATYLLLGTITDTGRFSYEKDSIRTFANALEMIKYGADKKFLIDNLQPTYDKIYFELLRVFLDRIVQNNGLVYSYMLSSDILLGNINDYDSFREFIMNYKGVNLSIYITLSQDNYLKFSMRSRNGSAGNVAKNFGGGGHDNAGSFALQVNEGENITQFISQIITDIQMFYQKL